MSKFHFARSPFALLPQTNRDVRRLQLHPAGDKLCRARNQDITSCLNYTRVLASYHITSIVDDRPVGSAVPRVLPRGRLRVPGRQHPLLNLPLCFTPPVLGEPNYQPRLCFIHRPFSTPLFLTNNFRISRRT